MQPEPEHATRLARLIAQLKAQNWTAIAIEFVIVVIGVGAALLAQQWANNWTDQTELEQTETQLQDYLFLNYRFAKERVAYQPCRLNAFKTLGAELLKEREDWPGMKFFESGKTQRALPGVLISASRPWGGAVWDAALARGTFDRMERAKRNWLDAIFGQADRALALQQDILSLQARLKVLAQPTTLTRSDRLRYYDVLAELDDKSALLELVSSQIIAAIDDIGINVSDSDRIGALQELEDQNDEIRKRYGDCATRQTFPALEKGPKRIEALLENS